MTSRNCGINELEQLDREEIVYFLHMLRVAAGIFIAFLIASIIIWLIIISPAHAHDWYPDDCCHAADKDGNHGECHPLASCDEVVPTENGLTWHDYTFSPAQVRKSQDNKCHVCASPALGTGDKIVPDATPHCLFVYEKPDS